MSLKILPPKLKPIMLTFKYQKKKDINHFIYVSYMSYIWWIIYGIHVLYIHIKYMIHKIHTMCVYIYKIYGFHNITWFVLIIHNKIYVLEQEIFCYSVEYLLLTKVTGYSQFIKLVQGNTTDDVSLLYQVS